MSDHKVLILGLNRARDKKNSSESHIRTLMVSAEELGLNSGKVGPGDIIKGEILTKVLEKGKEGFKLEVNIFKMDTGEKKAGTIKIEPSPS